MASVSASDSYGNPVWHSPCSAGTRASQTEFAFQGIEEPNVEEMDRYLRQLIVELSVARTSARRADRYIRRKRLFSSSLLVPDCQSLPSLLGMPQVAVTHELAHREFHTTLPYDFQRLATLAVFMSEMSRDTHGYRTRLDSLLVSIRNTMCLMEIVALSHQQPIRRDVTLNVMPDVYKNLDVLMTDMRNCLVVRDAAQIFDNLHEWYAQWV